MPKSRAIRQVATRLGFALAVVVLAQEASAHSLSVTRGTAILKGGTLTIELERNEHGTAPLARLTIRDHEGARLTGRRDATQDLTLHYKIPSGSPYVSFQLAPPSFGSATHAAIVALAVRVDGKGRNAIRLANDGNVEIVHFATMPPGQDSADPHLGGNHCGTRREQWFAWRNQDRSVRSIVSVEEWGVHIELLIPTPVIETWLPITRASRDFIESIEQNRAIAKVNAFFADRFDVRVNESRFLRPTTEAKFLDFWVAEPASDRAPGRRCAWTSRLYVSLRFRSADRPNRVEIGWKLFNAVVLTANALMVTPDEDHELVPTSRQHRFSKYKPRWVWPRP